MPVNSTASHRSESATTRAGQAHRMRRDDEQSAARRALARRRAVRTSPGAPAARRHSGERAAAAAAVFNLTAVGGTAPTTFLSVAPALAGHTCPTTAPAFSNVNPAAGNALFRTASSRSWVRTRTSASSAPRAASTSSSTSTAGSARRTRPGGRALLLDPAHSGLRHATDSSTTCSVPSGPGLTPGESDPILIAGVDGGPRG